MSSLITAGDATNGVSLTAGSNGVLTLQSGLAGNKVNALVLAADGTPTWLRPPITLGTVQNTTSGTSIDFTGIPAGVRRVTVMFNGVSTNGTSDAIVQIGPVGGVETTGYVGSSFTLIPPSTVGSANPTAGFILGYQNTASTAYGSMVFNLIDSATNTWVSNVSTAVDSNVFILGAGRKALAGALSRLRLTTIGGVNTFDAGSVNIMWEF